VSVSVVLPGLALRRDLQENSIQQFEALLSESQKMTHPLLKTGLQSLLALSATPGIDQGFQGVGDTLSDSVVSHLRSGLEDTQQTLNQAGEALESSKQQLNEDSSIVADKNVLLSSCVASWFVRRSLIADLKEALADLTEANCGVNLNYHDPEVQVPKLTCDFATSNCVQERALFKAEVAAYRVAASERYSAFLVALATSFSNCESAKADLTNSVAGKESEHAANSCGSEKTATNDALCQFQSDFFTQCVKLQELSAVVESTTAANNSNSEVDRNVEFNAVKTTLCALNLFKQGTTDLSPENVAALCQDSSYDYSGDIGVLVIPGSNTTYACTPGEIFQYSNTWVFNETWVEVAPATFELDPSTSDCGL
jgi:hypothetical protein